MYTLLSLETKQSTSNLVAGDNEEFADVQGQIVAKRALEIVAAGGHNLLMVGPPGSGKTMLARRITSIMPAMSPQEALEVTKIYSINHAGLVTIRPFRSPHHTISGGMVINRVA